MIRARFQANESDPRPVNWPIKHPYWVTGYGDGYAIVVAYADNEAEILSNWPDAVDINIEQSDDYVFTSRFAKPSWWVDIRVPQPN